MLTQGLRLRSAEWWPKATESIGDEGLIHVCLTAHSPRLRAWTHRWLMGAMERSWHGCYHTSCTGNDVKHREGLVPLKCHTNIMAIIVVILLGVGGGGLDFTYQRIGKYLEIGSPP